MLDLKPGFFVKTRLVKASSLRLFPAQCMLDLKPGFFVKTRLVKASFKTAEEVTKRQYSNFRLVRYSNGENNQLPE